MSLTTDVSNLTNTNKESYTARAKIGENGVDVGTSTITGDRSGSLFKNAEKEMGKDDFLLLLVTQLRYQDPLNPMENTEFVAQLAQFRALEGSQNVEKAIEKLDESFKGTVSAQQFSAQSIANTAAVGLIGKSVRVRQSTLEWEAQAGAKTSMRVHLGNTSDAAVEIRDSEDNVVATLLATGKDAENSATVVWDGTTDKGTMAPSGNYKVHIVGQEENSALYAFVQDQVSGIRFSPEGALVKIGGREMSIGSVLDVSTQSQGVVSGSMGTSTAVALLGKTVRLRQNSVMFNQKPGEQVSFNVNAGAGQPVTVELIDKLGRTVMQKTVLSDQDNIAKITWNGEMSGGNYADAGEYRIRIVGQDKNPSLYAFSQGRVEGIADLSGDARVRVGGQLFSLSQIIDISETGA